MIMKWKEPNAYFRKNLTLGFQIKIYAILAVAMLILSPAIFRNNPQYPVTMLFLAYFFLCTVLFLSHWFGSAGSAVRVKEDRIVKTGIIASGRVYFANVKDCCVRHETYNATNFFILKFTIIKGSSISQVKEIGVPNDQILEQILQFLKDKGVQIVEAP